MISSTSAAASASSPGLKPQEIVFALPLKDDSKIQLGTVTFTSNKPLETEILPRYDPKNSSNH